MHLFWTAAILDPSETVLAQMELFRDFNTISISDVQLPVRNQEAALPSKPQSLININNSIKDSGELLSPLFTAKSLQIRYLCVSHLRHAEQFFCG